MVSRATKRIWHGVALGLALGPVVGLEGIGFAQTPDQAPPISAVRESKPAAGAPADKEEAARQLIKQGRQALQQGDKAKAEKLARQAADMHVQWGFWETDTPEKLLLDIGVKSTPPPAGAGMPTTTDPHVMVKHGFEALKQGKLDDAQRLAQQAKAKNTKWGLFED